MKKFLVLALAMVLWAGQSWAIEFTFSDQDFLSGASWGTMTITAEDSSTLKVIYAASSLIPAGSEATGFGFTFSSGFMDAIANPLDGAFDWDQDNLNWVKLNNLNPIPGPSNGDEFIPNVTQFDFEFGATEGNANNINPPGILPGQSDVFYLEFSGLLIDLLTADLAQFVELTGVRLQSLPNDINTGSLFLVGRLDDGGTGEQDVIPEPSTIILLGAGLLGLGFWYRRKKA